MDAAPLLLVISGIGVAFGWQPMPDGSQRYEYIVQVEPELAKTLAAGQSIPIVGDIPDEVQPVGRISLVVGREAPPRQRLVTRLKPASDGSGAGGSVELAQYNRYGEPAYSPAPAAQAPPSASPRTAVATPETHAPGEIPQGGQPDGNAWNNGDAPITPTESTPPSTSQLFGQPSGGTSAAGNSWNGAAALQDAADAAVGAAADSASRLGSELQQAAQPALQKGIERIDSEVRGAADNFGDRTRNLVKELHTPFQRPQLSADNRQPAPGAAPDGPQSWNQEQSAASGDNLFRSGSSEAGATWNNQNEAAGQGDARGSAAPLANTQPSAGATAGAGSASIQWNTGDNAASDPRNGGPPAQQAPQGSDPWAGVPDPRAQNGGDAGSTGGQGGIPGVATRPLPFGGLGGNLAANGPQFPGVQNPPLPGNAGAAQAGAAGTAAVSPEVRSDMLRQPADRPLDGDATQPIAATPTPAGTPTTPATNIWGGAPQPATPAAEVPPSSGTASTSPPVAAAPAPRDNTVAVLVAWVLLSGSIAGNLYLFWSYLDVRQKYRALVRKTARAVGSRFSAA